MSDNETYESIKGRRSIFGNDTHKACDEDVTDRSSLYDVGNLDHAELI